LPVAELLVTLVALAVTTTGTVAPE